MEIISLFGNSYLLIHSYRKSGKINRINFSEKEYKDFEIWYSAN